MAFELEQIVPWGRSLDEYIDMFSLTDSELGQRIVGCGDGPASFNAELTQRGGHVISIDPIYRFSRAEIKKRIQDVSPIIYEQIKAEFAAFNWERFKSPKDLVEKRIKTMELFLRDFESGLGQGRYMEGELPVLPFSDHSFDLTLCSHFLFLYGDQLSVDFHIVSILELLRVSEQVRIFPLVELDGSTSRHLEQVIEEINAAGHECSIKPVQYEFQKGGNNMLEIKHAPRPTTDLS